jgi:hypothetical protein
MFLHKVYTVLMINVITNNAISHNLLSLIGSFRKPLRGFGTKLFNGRGKFGKCYHLPYCDHMFWRKVYTVLMWSHIMLSVILYYHS